MTDKPKPTPYKFCEAHMRPDYGPNRCNQCFGPVANPVNDEPVQKVNKVVHTLPIKNDKGEVELMVLKEPEPPLTDPTAQKVVEAAQNYARAREAVKIISEQLVGAKELVAALEKQLKGNQDIADAAQNELRQAATT